MLAALSAWYLVSQEVNHLKQSTLGSSIRSLRIKKKLTQAQLADILGVTDKAVSKWERDLSYPDIALFPKLADILGTSVDGLLRECQEEYRQPKLLQTFRMSRDIRLPLHIILGFVEIIKNNHDDPEMLQKYLDGIRISGEYMLSLLNRFQDDPLCCGSRNMSVEDYHSDDSKLEYYLREHISSAQNRPHERTFEGTRVLVVEDMAVNREIAAEILKQAGAGTEFAENGQECLDMLENAPAGYYDMILMDIMMPVMDGIEATRRIRKLSDPDKAAIPVIAMTTNVSDDDRNAAMEAGMDAFEEKPILVDRLFETMRKHLHKD